MKIVTYFKESYTELVQKVTWPSINQLSDVYKRQVLQAENEGLGICYLGTTTYNAQEIAEVLGLPEGVIPVTTLTMGYPDKMPPLTDRLPLEGVVHRERYHDYTPEPVSYTHLDVYKRQLFPSASSPIRRC